MGKAILVAGLGYGDEGKGSVVDHLVRREGSSLVVRYNGGAQAAHNVVTDDGRHHTFAQFGSGTFAGARTFLSRFMLFNPAALIPEARHLIEIGVPDPYKLLTVDEAALVTTPFHVAANRIREIARNSGRHGSCGMGIGETRDYDEKHGRADSITVSDLRDPAVLRAKLALMCQRLETDIKPLFDPSMPAMRPEWDIFQDFDTTLAVWQPYVERVVKHVEIVSSDWLVPELAKDQTVVFEGAQGVLLDENYGFHPHTTWSTTTFEWAEKLVGSRCPVTRLGVLRGYMTRHGAGPFVTEDENKSVPKSEHNTLGRWQADFRMGHFDGVMLRYALDVVGGVDQLALTCLDHLQGLVRSTWEYTLRERPLAELKSPDSPRWDRIPVKRVGSDLASHLQTQESLGRMLPAFRPIYQESFNVETFIDQVEKAVETPIKFLSFGPRASDKRER